VVDLGGLADKAKNLAEQNADKVDAALEKAGELAKDRFGHDEQVDTAVDKIKNINTGTGSE
jgi:hypothetical protein